MPRMSDRLARLEAGLGGFPWHVPLERWTDSQLARLLEPGVIKALPTARLELIVPRKEH